ncbi:MAG: DUF4416 family protein [Chloroflexota bacterium]|nr:DUF4416 family protein [Chloroflexota bacterium]
MGNIREPLPVKLIASMFTTERGLFEVAREKLVERLGPVGYESELLPFEHTDYYTPEFGENLVREFVAFGRLIDPGRLAEIKRFTNALEMELAVEGKRRINIDPGYVSLSKLVLATTKNYSHRMYLGGGIYAEVTLRFRKGSFEPWEWTYPDYASREYCELFNRIRELYVEQLRPYSTLTNSKTGSPPRS